MDVTNQLLVDKLALKKINLALKSANKNLQAEHSRLIRKVEKRIKEIKKTYEKKLIFLPEGNGITLFGTATEVLGHLDFLDLELDLEKIIEMMQKTKVLTSSSSSQDK